MPDANHSSLGKRRSTSWLKLSIGAEEGKGHSPTRSELRASTARSVEYAMSTHAQLPYCTPASSETPSASADQSIDARPFATDASKRSCRKLANGMGIFTSFAVCNTRLTSFKPSDR